MTDKKHLTFPTSEVSDVALNDSGVLLIYFREGSYKTVRESLAASERQDGSIKFTAGVGTFYVANRALRRHGQAEGSIIPIQDDQILCVFAKLQALGGLAERDFDRAVREWGLPESPLARTTRHREAIAEVVKRLAPEQVDQMYEFASALPHPAPK